MRWPIQTQLLVPMLGVAVAAIGLASVGIAYVGARQARAAQEESLGRVVATLAEAPFPLVEPVLQQMSGLSGAEFVLVDRDDVILASTLALDDAELPRLRDIHADASPGDLADRPAIVLGGKSFLCQRVAVTGRVPAGEGRSLLVLYPEDRRTAVAREAAYPALAAGALAAVAVVIVTTLLSHRFVGPIRRLCRHAAAIARGDFRPAAMPPRNDEIRDLAASINRMAEQLGEYEVEVRRNEQLRTLGQIGAGMAHQLRNAATGGRMAIELHQRECPTGGNEESLGVALRQLRLMESYIQRFLSLGRESDARMEAIDLAAIVEDALSLVRPSCAHAEIKLDCVGPDETIRVRGDAEALRQLVVNLALNAVEAARGGAESARSIEVRVNALGRDRAALHVRDNGPGPSSQVGDRLFEPFVSGNPEGTGLGLYVARQVAERHNGSISWHREGATTCFAVELPRLLD